ncbi:MAG: hypothetical protein U0232_01010 [Thermomicrobiales bacterium]
MPTSPNRRRIEIPAALFARLEERARRDGQTLSGLVASLLASSLDAPNQPSPGTERGSAGNPDVRELLQQVLSNDLLQLRELQLLQQRLDLTMRLLVEDQLPADRDPGVAPAAHRASRQRLLDALTETYVAVPLQPGTTLAQAGEPRPIVSRTLWQRPKETPARDPSERPEEE